MERALLPAAFELAVALGLILEAYSKVTIKTKSSGQECPLHMGNSHKR